VCCRFDDLAHGLQIIMNYTTTDDIPKKIKTDSFGDSSDLISFEQETSFFEEKYFSVVEDPTANSLNDALVSNENRSTLFENQQQQQYKRETPPSLEISPKKRSKFRRGVKSRTKYNGNLEEDPENKASSILDMGVKKTYFRKNRFKKILCFFSRSKINQRVSESFSSSHGEDGNSSDNTTDTTNSECGNEELKAPNQNRKAPLEIHQDNDNDNDLPQKPSEISFTGKLRTNEFDNVSDRIIEGGVVTTGSAGILFKHSVYNNERTTGDIGKVNETKQHDISRPRSACRVRFVDDVEETLEDKLARARQLIENARNVQNKY